MANKVDVDAIRKAGTKLAAPDGPIQYLRNVQALLESVKLPAGVDPLRAARPWRPTTPRSTITSRT